MMRRHGNPNENFVPKYANQNQYINNVNRRKSLECMYEAPRIKQFHYEMQLRDDVKLNDPLPAMEYKPSSHAQKDHDFFSPQKQNPILKPRLPGLFDKLIPEEPKQVVYKSPDTYMGIEGRHLDEGLRKKIPSQYVPNDQLKLDVLNWGNAQKLQEQQRQQAQEKLQKQQQWMQQQHSNQNIPGYRNYSDKSVFMPFDAQYGLQNHPIYNPFAGAQQQVQVKDSPRTAYSE